MARIGPIMLGQNSPDDVRVQLDIEYQRYLVRNSLVAEGWIPALHFTDGSTGYVFGQPNSDAAASTYISVTLKNGSLLYILR